MLSPTADEFVRISERIHQILWVAMTIATLLYVPLTYFFIYKSGYNPPVAYPLLPSYLTGGAIFLGVGSIALRRLLLSDSRLCARLAREPNLEELAAKLGTDELGRTRKLKLENLSSLEKKLVALPSWLLVVSLINWSLNSMIALIGFIVALLTVSFQNMVPFAVAALILNIVMVPRLQPVIERASRLTPAL